jgi:hypothetical protein
MTATVGRDHAGDGRVLLREQATPEAFSGYAVGM